MLSMNLAKIVREFAGLNAWKMYKLMGKKTVQSYLSFERKAKTLELKDFFALERIYVQHGGTKEDFDKLARKCAKQEK